MLGQKLIVVCSYLMGGCSSNAVLPESLLGMLTVSADSIFFCMVNDNLIQDVFIRYLFEHRYVELNYVLFLSRGLPQCAGEESPSCLPQGQRRSSKTCGGKNTGTGWRCLGPKNERVPE